MGSDVDVDEPIAALTSAERSIVAIARALALDADILVLDEPTASLPETDVSRLFDILRGLRDRGMGIVFVSHRLDEVFRLADRVTVLRDGRRIATTIVAETLAVGPGRGHRGPRALGDVHRSPSLRVPTSSSSCRTSKSAPSAQ